MGTSQVSSCPHGRWYRFDELSLNQLYSLLRLREQVFMLEQDSLYEDLDNQDQGAEHLLVERSGELVGYLRLLPGEPVKLGRIVLPKSERGGQLGRQVIRAGIERARQENIGTAVKISAQLALLAYYQSFGFVATSEPYDDGGVLHLDMVLSDAE